MSKDIFFQPFREWIQKAPLLPMPVIWGVTCLIIAVLVGIGLHEYFSAEKAVAKQFNAQQWMLAQQAARGIQNYLDDLRELTYLLTRDHEVRRFKPEGSKALVKKLSRSFRGKADFLFLCDSKGALVASSPPGVFEERIGETFSLRPFAEETRTQGKSIIRTIFPPTRPDPGEESPASQILLIMAPIQQDSEFLGFMGCGLDIARINREFVHPIQSGITGGAWMINPEGRFIAHFDAKMIGKDATAMPRKRGPGVSPNKIDRLIQEEMLQGKSGMDDYVVANEGGEGREIRRLIAYAPIPIGDEIWSIAVDCPYSDVTHVVWGSFRKSAWLLAIMAVTLLSGTYVGHRMNQERIRAEEKVRWSEEILKTQNRLQTIIDGAPDAISIIDRQYRIQMLNRTGLRWYQRPLEDFRGKPCYQEFQGLATLCPNCPAEETFRTGQPAFRSKASLVAGGKKYYLQIFTFPVWNRSGEVENVVEYVKDVTAERELQQRIIQTERLAVVGRMAANVAHEIKNPLGTIVLNVELLEEELERLLPSGRDIAEARSLLSTIRSEIDRLVEVIHEYLQFARLPKMKPERGNVNEVLGELLEFLREEIAARKIFLVQELSPAVPSMNMDRHQLRQAFLNIIKNSFDAMPQGGKLTVRTAVQNGHVKIEIADTGLGIAEKNSDLIFTPFFSTKRGGTGLGLPITAHIVQEHQGEIDFESYEDLGTVFRIRLPIDVTKSPQNGEAGKDAKKKEEWNGI